MGKCPKCCREIFYDEFHRKMEYIPKKIIGYDGSSSLVREAFPHKCSYPKMETIDLQAQAKWAGGRIVI